MRLPKRNRKRKKVTLISSWTVAVGVSAQILWGSEDSLKAGGSVLVPNACCEAMHAAKGGGSHGRMSGPKHVIAEPNLMAALCPLLSIAAPLQCLPRTCRHLAYTNTIMRCLQATILLRSGGVQYCGHGSPPV